MSERWARAVLSTYRWAGVATYPIMGSYMAARAGKGGGDGRRRPERYGHAALPRPHGPLIWIHAVGEGEAAAVIGLVEAILEKEIDVVLTTGSVASAALVEERLGGRVIHQFVPLDVKPAVSRFLNHWRPDLAIMAESEIWPMTILELGKRRIPQVLVNGRMSDRAFASWSKRYNIAEALFENLALVVAQSDTDAERFTQLGARPVVTSGPLRTDTLAPPCHDEVLDGLKAALGNRRRWMALRTVAGEEALVAKIHARLKREHPDLVTILVPADPQRADGIEELLVRDEMVVSRRGRGDRITARTDILLGDTRGESGLYARLGRIALMGGTIGVEGRGQNPLDCVLCGCAVVAGENVGYHRDVYEPLVEAGGVRIAPNARSMAATVHQLLKNDRACASIARAGERAAQDMRGAVATTVRALQPFIQPLVVQARLAVTDTVRD